MEFGTALGVGELQLAPSLTEISCECSGSQSVLNALGFEREDGQDICGWSGTGEESQGLDATLARESERGEGRGRGGRMEKGSGEMVWILRIFGFYAFWALLWRAPSSSLAHRATDVCGYNGDYVCPAETSLSPKVLSGCC